MLSTLKRAVGFLLLVAVSAVFIIFAVTNRDYVELNLSPLSYSAEMPKFLWVLACIALGAGIAVLFMMFSFIRCRHELRQARRRIMALENEIGGLKSERPPSTLPTIRHG